MALIRMRISVVGGFHNNPSGVNPGDEIEVDDVWAERYVSGGWADYVSPTSRGFVHPPVEKAVAPEHETAKLEIPSEIAALAKPKPLDEPEPVYGETDPPDDAPELATKRQAPAKSTARRAGK